MEGTRAGACPKGVEPPQIGGGTQEVSVSGHRHSYLLYVPRAASDEPHIARPLVLLAPSSRTGPETMLRQSELAELSEAHGFVIAVLIGSDKLNLHFRRRRLSAQHRGDRDYVRSVIAHASSITCIDPARVACTGMSRGARFCSVTVRELSDVISIVVPVSGVRFPRHMRAPRGVPLLTFHGTADHTNPFRGGGPKYWGSSVHSAVKKWKDFNGCRRALTFCAGDLTAEVHTDCRDGADVVLCRVEGGGHRWPREGDAGSGAPHPNSVIWSFLQAHWDAAPLNGSAAPGWDATPRNGSAAPGWGATAHNGTTAAVGYGTPRNGTAVAVGLGTEIAWVPCGAGWHRLRHDDGAPPVPPPEHVHNLTHYVHARGSPTLHEVLGVWHLTQSKPAAQGPFDSHRPLGWAAVITVPAAMAAVALALMAALRRWPRDGSEASARRSRARGML